jgi:hypothetical protein
MTSKEYAFDRSYTKQELEAAWENAKSKGNKIINNLSAHGATWQQLSKRCIDQLIQRYGVDDSGKE